MNDPAQSEQVCKTWQIEQGRFMPLKPCNARLLECSALKQNGTQKFNLFYQHKLKLHFSLWKKAEMWLFLLERQISFYTNRIGHDPPIRSTV